MNLQGRKIILGITGSIAAYKSAVLLRGLIKAGAEVQVIMTDGATAFVAPLTFQVLSKRPVYQRVMDNDAWNNHVELGLWADLMIIAPCTAQTLAKLACGMAPDMLSAVYLSARCPVWIAPAMDLDMWTHPATTDNLDTLQRHGVQILEPGTGFLASGLEGKGRMAEPEDIIEQISDHFAHGQALAGKNIVVNAGPTQEAIDPVRYISNHSSGKMGIAIADRAAALGADVTLVLGPTALRPKHPNVTVHSVTSAADMRAATLQAYEQADVAILSAAVSDYRPVTVYDQKYKKKDENWCLELEKTADIASEMGRMKKDHQILIGFALETEKLEEHAMKKLVKKNLDFIVVNRPSENTGFQHDTNKISILYRDNKIDHYELKAKTAVADDILQALIAISS